MDTLGADVQTRRPASAAVGTEGRARRASGSTAKTAVVDVSQHPAAVAYQAAHPKRAIPRFGPYLLLQTLGEGEFGKVKLGLHATWGEEVAVKLIRRGNVENALRMSKVEREIEVLRTINHPNIVRLYDVIETDKYIGIVLEYASGGELFDHILAHRFLRERDACKLFAQLISGVSYIHQKKIVHRDLKLENLLLDRNRNVIITDFGFANRFEHRPDDLMQTSCGSPCYAAPELVISEGEYVGSAVDIWSCGVILYAMLAGYLPFDDDPANPDGDNINLLYKYIVTTPLTFPDYVSQAARDLLARMLVPDPKHRADLATIMAHPWLAPYATQFQLSVEQLEQQAVEQQLAKRMAYQRQIRKKQQGQSSQVQAQPKPGRAQSTRPAAVDDQSDLLYTSAASPSRRERAGASAIVLPSPSAAVDTDMLSADGAQAADAPAGERKSKGYRHTIQLEYDVGTREGTPPVPSIQATPQPIPADAPQTDAKVPGPTDSPFTAPKDITQTPKAPSQRRSASNIRAASASRAVPPSAFTMSNNSTRSVSASAADATSRSASTEPGPHAPSVDTNVRSLDYSMSGDEVSVAGTPEISVPTVQVSVPPTGSPIDEADVLAALNGGGPGRAPSLKNGTVAHTNGVNGKGEHSHGPGIRVDGLPLASALGGENVLSPAVITPTSTESAGLPTPVVVEPSVSVESKPAKPLQVRSDSTQSRTEAPVQTPSLAGPVRNVSTTSSSGGSKSRSRHSTKPSEKPVDDENVGNTSVSSSKSRRKTLSLMVEPFQRPFRTRTPVDATPAHATGQIIAPERKDSQPPRSAPPSNFSSTTAPASSIAPVVTPIPTPAPSAYKSNTERFMAEGQPAGPASATSKAKRVMNWFRKRSLAPESPAPVATPIQPPMAETNGRLNGAGVRSQTEGVSRPAQANSSPRVPQIEPKHSGGLDSVSNSSEVRAMPPSIVKPGKPVVNRAGMRVHEGAVDQAMVTSGSPLDALAHAEAVLAEMGIAFQKESEFKFRCVRHKKRKAGTGSVGPLGGLNAGMAGSAASNGVDRRGLPLPPPPSFTGPGGMLRGLLRRSSAQPGMTTPEVEPQSLLPEPIYGERTDDAQDEVRFFVELTRIDRLEDTYSIDVRRLKGNLRSYKFLYDTLRERCLPRLQTIN